MSVITGTTAQGLPFLLRPYRKKDIAELPGVLSNKNVTENLLLVPYPYTEQDARDWVNQNIYSRPYKANNKVWALEVEGKIVGTIGLADIQKAHKAIIGYWLAEPWWNKGLTTAAVALVVEFGFKEYDLARLEAGIFHWNTASRRVLEKNGFELEGIMRKRLANKFGRLGDEHMYSIIRETESSK